MDGRKLTVVIALLISFLASPAVVGQSVAEKNMDLDKKETSEAVPRQAEAQILPAGTLLSVKLHTTLTSKTSTVGEKFIGMIDKAVVINGKEIVPIGTIVDGHVAFVKPSGRFHGKAEMRLVLDDLQTPDDIKISLNSGLESANAGPCAKTGKDNEGTIQGCGKSKKEAAKDAALGGAIGAGTGVSVGITSEMECAYWGICGGPGIAESAGIGAAIGAGSVLVYHLLKHEKQIVLVSGMTLTFLVNRSVEVLGGESRPNSSPAH